MNPFNGIESKIFKGVLGWMPGWLESIQWN